MLKVEEEQLTALRRWGEGLRMDDREEVRAAGRAIVLLCDDVERLEMKLWQLRTRAISPHDEPADQNAVDFAGEPGDSLVAAGDADTELKARLRRLLAAVVGR
jgi:hypothetical protein